MRLDLPCGSLLFHGTGTDFPPDDLQAPCWFTRSIEVARHFATRSDEGNATILSFRTTAAITLPLIRGPRAFDRFCERHAISPYSAEDMAEGVRRAGLPGWIIPDNYPDGDDILLVSLDHLDFEGLLEM